MELLDQTDEPVTAAPPVTQTDAEELDEEDRELDCAACGHPITHTKHRTSVGGLFQHTCVNPAGILFEIGCFTEAQGCRHLGPESDDFTWFDGYTWQVAVCQSCRAHLGWRFWSADNEFWGLILNRLA